MSKPTSVPLETAAMEAADLICDDRPLIDIRSDRERELGVPDGAVTMSLDSLLEQCLNPGQRGLAAGYVICAEGVRSLKAVKRLRESGFDTFSSVSGGFKAWRDAGLPATFPAGMTAEQCERYARHLVMPQVGAEGQRKLLNSRILLVGLGGLNSPVALYLAAAGVGSLGLVDHDCVERSNLQRQVVHGEANLGEQKVRSAMARIRDLNPDVEVRIYDQMIDQLNAESVIEPWDIVIDGTDSFPTRYALNDACIAQSKPLVYGAVMRYQGQVSVFWSNQPQPAGSSAQAGPCFRCLMPLEPGPGDAPACSEAGVVGIMPGIIGTLQANEALKLVMGIGQPLIGSLLLIDALNMDFRRMRIPANPRCPSCSRS